MSRIADRPFEVGVVLPNHGAAPRLETVWEIAAAAEELGFDSVFVTERLIAGPDAPDYFSAAIDAFTTLAWLAARLPRVRLGTSVSILPLHDPFVLAKQAVNLQQLSGGRFRLGVGTGWYQPEFEIAGRDFARRGAVTDEQLRLVKALWRGDSSFAGEQWSFSGARFGPLPEPVPEIWVGGDSPRALRRARELGDVWHPLLASPETIRAAKRDWPDGRIVLRTRLREEPPDDPRKGLGGDTRQVAAGLAEIVAAGADGVVMSFSGEEHNAVDRMRFFAREVLPRLDARRSG